MPSQTLKKKDLYLGKCLGDLSKLSEVKINTENVTILIKSLNRLFDDAARNEQEGDDEKAYVLYLKYFSLLKIIKTKADYKKQKDYFDKIIGTKNQLLAIEKAEKLSESLKERYDLKEAEAVAKKLSDVAVEIKDEPAIVSQEKENVIPKAEEKSAETPGLIMPMKLCELLRDSNTKVTVIDVRSEKDFSQSHISFTECINVPEDILAPGSTVSHIQSKLPTNSRSLWAQRGHADFIILLDWKSTLTDVLVGTPLRTLKDALYKFDTSTIIKSEPLILQGGYENWLLLYPTMSTNPHIMKPSDAARVNPPSPTMTLDFDYPDFDDNLQPKVSSANQGPSNESMVSNDMSPALSTYSSLPKVDRSLKPSTSKDNLISSKPNNSTSGQVISLNNIINNVESIPNPNILGHLKNTNITNDSLAVNEPKSINLSIKNNLASDLSASVENREEKENELKNLQQTKAAFLMEHQEKVKALEQKLLDLDKIKKKEEKDVADLMRLKKKMKEDLDKEKQRQDQEIKSYEKEEKIKLLALEMAKKEEDEKKRRLEEVEKLRQDRKKDEKLKELEKRFEKQEEERKRLAAEALRLKEEEEEELRFEKLMQEEKRIKELEQRKEFEKKLEEERKINQEKLKEMEEMKRAQMEAEKFKQEEERKARERAALEKKTQEEQREKEAANEKALKERQMLEQAERIQREKEAANEKAIREKQMIEQAERIKREREAAAKKLEEVERIQKQIIAKVEAPASKAIPSTNLPVGWEKRLDRTTNTYYYIDHNKGLTQWTPPATVGTKTIVKLKDEPNVSSSLGLSRSFSSPNIKKQLEDEEALRQSLPTINRGNKPRFEHKSLPPRSAYSIRKRDLNPVYGNVGPALTGLKNLGNTCYMNSTIQCLNNTSPLIRYFLDDSYLYDINRESSQGMQGEVVDEFAVVVKALWSGDYRSITPRDLKNTISKYYSAFAGFQQQDSQEFLTFLLDGLHEGLNEVRNAPEIPEQNNEQLNDFDAAHLAWKHHKLLNKSIIVELFQGQLKSTLMCRTCGKKSVTFQVFMSLSLPIPASSRCSLMDCLKEFLKPEILTGSSKWKCPSCRVEREAEKKIDLWKLPPILLIGLNRFYVDGMWQKKTTFVDFPVNDHDFSQVVIGPPTRQRYNLYGVSNHFGTMEGGHYTAFCKNPVNKKWYKFDDQDVYEMSSSDVKSPAAFVLYYTSMDMPIPV
ncbi:ubiquitin carboxyl-terminal hydrolase 8-like isoform X1 [Biomphalaria glabrata]|uniref:ubiquitinyl hydrolase 1 n=1 Tax=Biomphalaria glabrata TaxID=6526 RepID=A0A9W2YWX3_BIOGL|nr:ubiquitin carboxyl-terminal hydrolase 8-like isoform X1 [Biomphalaria glabrata]XP_055867222.1 ubiquitin carboxyl-terminal hydrolase 8-like isoform X1 [Biomphalaria glabrata]XP_055867232.1 ubiquitin carboxyl-terminal hydrolase 8-like isoform X1 [Biomphalaria glabrata]